MIHYLVTAAHAYTITEFLDSWGTELAGRVTVLPYERLPRLRDAAPGVYVFSDLERLSRRMRARACAFHRQLTCAGPAFRVLNDPQRTLTRYRLLRALHESGGNDFRVFRPLELLRTSTAGAPGGPRYPVFLRLERAHRGGLTDLLPDASALRAGLWRTLRKPRQLRHRLLIVEFRDTSDAAGRFRKRGALRIGDALVPRHVMASTRWEVKYADVVDAAAIREEEDFLERFPDHDPLRRIFDLARVEYGRIDYSVHAGAIQVWEINTNPMIVPSPARIAPARLAGQARSAQQVIAALVALEDGLPAGAPMPPAASALPVGARPEAVPPLRNVVPQRANQPPTAL